MWDLGLHIPHYPPQVWLVCGGCCAQTVVQVSVSESIALLWLDKSHSWKGTFTHIGWPETCQNLLCTKRDIAVGIARYTKHPEIHHGFISITLLQSVIVFQFNEFLFKSLPWNVNCSLAYEADRLIIHLHKSKFFLPFLLEGTVFIFKLSFRLRHFCLPTRWAVSL